MKNTFNKVWQWLKNAAISTWEVADYIEVPSRSAWGDFKKYKQLQDSTISELATAAWGIPVVFVSSVLRFLVVKAYAVVAYILIVGGLLYRLATFWRKTK